MATVQMYCVRCRKKVNVVDAVQKVMKKGRSGVAMRAWAGTCPICGTRTYKFISRA